MIKTDLTDKTKQEAYDLIRTIYKFIPVYNQIKGSYLGIQFILNVMGLCAKIVELWGDRNDITNFSKDGTFYRETELFAVRRFLDDVVDEKAKLNDYYLTSRFDVDLISNKGINFKEFNGMAKTIIEVINMVRPVTRCLRKLYYVIQTNNNIHFNYLIDRDCCDVNTDSLTPPSETTKKYGLSFRRFAYLWNITDNPLSYKNEYDSIYHEFNKIYLPYKTIRAMYYNGPLDWLFNASYYNNTLENAYFNLFELETKLKKSHQETFKFIIYIHEKGKIEPVESREFINLEIGKDIIIKSDRNGFYINLEGNTRTLLSSFYENFDLNKYDLFLGTIFTMVLGTKYLYQDDSDLDVWDFEINGGFISETSDAWLIPEVNTEENTEDPHLIWEDA